MRVVAEFPLNWPLLFDYYKVLFQPVLLMRFYLSTTQDLHIVHCLHLWWWMLLWMLHFVFMVFYEIIMDDFMVWWHNKHKAPYTILNIMLQKLVCTKMLRKQNLWVLIKSKRVLKSVKNENIKKVDNFK